MKTYQVPIIFCRFDFVVIFGAVVATAVESGSGEGLTYFVPIFYAELYRSVPYRMQENDFVSVI